MSDFAENARLFRNIMRCRWTALSTLPADSTFARFAITQHICHPILGHLDEHGVEHLLPSSWLEPMRREIDSRSEKTARLADLMPELRAAFAHHGTEVLFLKGFAFAALYYDKPTHRRHGDIDLLVRRCDLSRALRILTDLGFAPKRKRIRRRSGEMTLRRQRLRTEHAITLYRDSLCVDLHWALRTAPSYRMDEEAPWASACAATFRNEAYPTLSHEQALTLLLISIAHDIGRGACKLKHILDVRQLLVKAADSIDWPMFFSTCEGENTLGVTRHALEAVFAVVDCEDELPDLTHALSRSRTTASGATQQLASRQVILDLLGNERGHPANAIWLLRVYPVNWFRDPIWFLDRHLPHPGRVFGASVKAARFTARCIAHAVR